MSPPYDAKEIRPFTTLAPPALRVSSDRSRAGSAKHETVIFVTHDLSGAIARADHIVVMTRMALGIQQVEARLLRWRPEYQKR